MPGRSRFLPLVFALVAWLPSVWIGGWALDDRELIEGNPVVDGSAPAVAAFERGYFAHRGPSEQWRPLSSLSLRSSHRWFGDRAFGYHLENLVLHLAVVALAIAICTRTLRGRAWVFGLCVFAAHPALADVVAWISGRTSSLGAAAGLAGALGVVRARSPRGVAIASALSVACAGLAKEDGVLFAPLCAALASRDGRRAFTASCAGSAVALLALAGGRFLALGGALPSAATPALGDAGLAERLLVGGHLWVEALRVSVLPFDFPPRYRLDFLFERSAWSPRVLTALVGWSLAFAAPFVARRCGAPRDSEGDGDGDVAVRDEASARVAFISASLAVVALLPAIQLVPIGEIFAPRFLYLPLLFAAPALGAVHARLPRPSRVVAWAVVAAAFVPLAWTRSTVYASRAAWHAEVLAHSPDDAPSWNDLGLALEETGDRDGARDAFVHATELRPTYSRAWSNLGRLALEDEDELTALACFERAAHVGPRNAVAHANLGSLRLRREEYAEAEVAYRRATELAPGMVAAWRGLARALHGQGRVSEARAALDRALDAAPADPASRRLRERWGD